MWAKRAEGACFKRCSSWATLDPVSTAVELATARCTALRLGLLIGGCVVFNMVCVGDLGAVILPVQQTSWRLQQAGRQPLYRAGVEASRPAAASLFGRADLASAAKADGGGGCHRCDPVPGQSAHLPVRSNLGLRVGHMKKPLAITARGFLYLVPER